MRRSQTGRYEVTTVAGETVRAFVPFPLPPDPGLDLTSPQRPIERAVLALGSLGSTATSTTGLWTASGAMAIGRTGSTFSCRE